MPRQSMQMKSIAPSTHARPGWRRPAVRNSVNSASDISPEAIGELAMLDAPRPETWPSIRTL